MRTYTKRILSVLLAALMLFSLLPAAALTASASAPETLYLKPNSNWLSDGARFAVYLFGNGEAWVGMTAGEDGIYKADIPSGYPSVIFCRMNGATTENNWDNKWNQTNDLTIPTDGKNCYTVADGAWSNGDGTWSEYTPAAAPVDPVYYLVGSISDWAPVEDYKLTEGTDGEWTLTDVALDVEDEVKIYDSANDLWYPNPGQNYVVTAKGTYDVSFFPAGEKEGYHGGYFKLTKQETGEPAAVNYYLVGDLNDWNVDLAFKLAKNDEAEGTEYYIDQDFDADDEFKIVSSTDGETAAVWFPDGMDNNYKISAAGSYRIYFRPDYDGGDDWHEKCIYAAKNLQTLPEITLPNGDFETGDTTNWVLTGLPENPVRSNEWNEPNKTNTLNLWAHDTEAVEIHAAYPVTLTAGTYRFSFDISGEGKDSNLRWTVYAGDTALITAAETVTTVDWNVWNTVTTDDFVLAETTKVTFDFGGTGPVKYWGDLDNLKLYGTGEIYEEPTNVVLDHTPTLAVEKVSGVGGDDFFRGTDVSSYLSIVNSGAKFYDYEGNVLTDQGFFDLLASAGFNYIRLRVWNDPTDGEGHGYGGGAAL